MSVLASSAQLETLLILLGIDIIAVFYPVPLVAMKAKSPIIEDVCHCGLRRIETYKI